MVAEINEHEGMKQDAEKVKQLAGLHVIASERHEARRIDLQLRGRPGRQGDPGSSRFFLSLEDDLMRVFAGPWVKGLLAKLGMKEGERIESKMVTRRIEAAQKKVEERNFEIRKNLLEYDEVMDEQRKRVYSYRQQILDGANCRDLMLKLVREQVDHHLDVFLHRDYGIESFAETRQRLAHCGWRSQDWRLRPGRGHRPLPSDHRRNDGGYTDLDNTPTTSAPPTSESIDRLARFVANTAAARESAAQGY